MQIVIAVLLIVISFFTFMIFLGGSHGQIQFRPYMTEDWIFWSLMIIPSLTGIVILTNRIIKSSKK